MTFIHPTVLQQLQEERREELETRALIARALREQAQKGRASTPTTSSARHLRLMAKLAAFFRKAPRRHGAPLSPRPRGPRERQRREAR